MRRKRKAKIVTATLPMEAMEKLAAEVCPIHKGWSAEGFRLTSKCRLWRRKDGTWTARFVHAKPAEPGFTMTTVVRGIVLR